MRQPTLFEAAEAARARPPDESARVFAVDPGNDVVLEASAGTGKTRVLVDRYVRLIEVGVDPRHMLAITFTRKAAAEMRERVLAALRRRAAEGGFTPERWRGIQGRLGDIEISTIDAFCFGLLREFPLEADVDPGFDVADETETGRFANEALELAFRIARPLVTSDEHLRLLFARVKQPVLRGALAGLLDRRQLAVPAVASFVGRHGGVGGADETGARFGVRLVAALGDPARLPALLDDGPHGAAEFRSVAADLTAIGSAAAIQPGGVQPLRRRLERYFLTRDGKARQKLSRPYRTDHFASPAARKRHEQMLAVAAPEVKAAFDRLDADIDVLLARGLARMLAIAVEQYEQLLEEHALLDFAGMLDRAVRLLQRQEEFARSRLKLQARYHHLLIDEFQDTSRLQWRLIELLIDTWSEGEGMADAPTSVFVVGDRKQSIYRFRHAEVTLLDEAARRIGALRPGRRVRQAISTSFRAVPELLAFINALGEAMPGDATLDDRWRYEATDRFPVPAVGPGARRDGEPVLGLIGEPSLAAVASAVGDEIAGLVGRTHVRDRSGEPRPARPDDIAILFRARAGHQFYEEALEARGVRTYVYKGLGFFDAPEVRDLQVLVRYLAQPDSDLRAAEWLRSRFVRVSDAGLARLAPGCAAMLLNPSFDLAALGLSPLDAALVTRLREALPRWLTLADRVPPSELVDLVLNETAYVFELRGRRLEQARENVKKVRALIRRVESRGYTTLDRLAASFETLRLGDDSNATIEASGAVNLMTIHAAKGLEFPIVFVVNLHGGGRGRPTGFSVIERGPSGEPEVCFGANAATELEDAREGEELRRLFYVAATRARDRLYLAAELDKAGHVGRHARSLASLLPASLANLFGTAATGATEAEWHTSHGSFAFRICRPAPAPVSGAALEPGAAAPLELRAAPAPLAPIPTAGSIITAATQTIAPTPGSRRPRLRGRGQRRAATDDRLVGTLVHRLFQRVVDARAGGLPAGLAATLLSTEERVDVSDADAVLLEAFERYRTLHQRPDVTDLLASGECFYEVPFSYAPPDQAGTCIRGAIDCLVVTPDGTATILEFKTGGARPEHQEQARLYREALESTGAFERVEVRLCYA
jgi:ATP-dependent helicase/nuclease subunit A